jgi:hypothetical protein
MRNEIWSESDRRKIWLHLDNCRVHNSKQSSEKIVASVFKRTPHPPYSPDVAPSDFFLFGYVMHELEGKHYTSEDELYEDIVGILMKTTKPCRLTCCPTCQILYERNSSKNTFFLTVKNYVHLMLLIITQRNLLCSTNFCQ